MVAMFPSLVKLSVVKIADNGKTVKQIVTHIMEFQTESGLDIKYRRKLVRIEKFLERESDYHTERVLCREHCCLYFRDFSGYPKDFNA